MEAYITVADNGTKAFVETKNLGYVIEKLDVYAKYVDWFSENENRSIMLGSFEYRAFEDVIKGYCITGKHHMDEYIYALAVRLENSGVKVFIRNGRNDEWKKYKGNISRDISEIEYDREAPLEVVERVNEIISLKQASSEALSNGFELVSKMIERRIEDLLLELGEEEEKEKARKGAVDSIWNV